LRHNEFVGKKNTKLYTLLATPATVIGKKYVTALVRIIAAYGNGTKLAVVSGICL